ncbi:MAG: hypothetical protein JNK15_01505, partial [Planctomycetes bacterium]|nr:hypothetical protein [Planctomycetota bacterium]
MSDVFDRLLEHLLREELAAAPRATDVAARVAAALAARAPAASGAARGDRMPRPRRLPIAIAIAAAAVVAVAVVWHEAQRPGMECSRPLLVAAGDAEPFARHSHVTGRAAVWCTGDGPAALTAADGSAASAAPGCTFAVDPRR